MGYSNYWHQKRSFTDSEWSEIKDYLSRIYERHHNTISLSEITDEVLQFNGQSSQSCEDFTLHKNIREPRYEDDMVELYEDDMVEFNFCKTQQHPYDEVVWKLLKFIKFVVLDPKYKSFSISNDNGDNYE